MKKETSYLAELGKIAVYLVSDRRISRPITAIRWLHRLGRLREVAAQKRSRTAQSRPFGLDFRLDCGSGRKSRWYRYHFMRRARAIQDLLSRGYSRDQALAVAESLYICDHHNWAAFGATSHNPDIVLPPAPDVSTDPDDGYLSAQSPETQRWSAWRNQLDAAAPPKIGKRTLRFFAAVERITAKQREKARQNRLSSMSARASRIAALVRPILGADEEGRGWLMSDQSIETTHDFALHRRPEWREQVAHIFTTRAGGCLGLHACTNPITLATNIAAQLNYEAGRANSPYRGVECEGD